MTDVIRGKYKLLEKIGQGKFGTVFKALNQHNNKMLAIKIENDKNFPILKNETIILNYLNRYNCKNIPEVHWYGTFNDMRCLVIPYYHYGLSQCIINKCQGINVNILMQNMLDILKECHESQVLHRDIKPDNFMFNSQNQLVLIDFGLSTFISTNNDDEESFVGNMIYASPNIHNCNKYKKIDDIISVAYIYLSIYLDGKLPWIGNLQEVLLLKGINNILSYKKDNCKNKIFSFLENAYKNNISYVI
jgi:serine/threonine protein kinase